MMAYAVLCHRTLPFVDTGEKRFGGEAEDLFQFVANDFQEFVVAAVQNPFIARTSQETADESAIFGSTVGKLVMDEGGRQHTSAFAARHQKAEAERQSTAHIVVVPERDCDGRAVANLAQLARQVVVGHVQQHGCGGRGDGGGQSAELVRLLYS